MPEVNTFACGICAAQRREANHWWIVRGITRGLVEIREFPQAQVWADIALCGNPMEAGCGEEHALQLAGRWMVSGSFDPPSQRPVSVAPASSRPFDRLRVPSNVEGPSEASSDSPSTGEENNE